MARKLTQNIFQKYQTLVKNQIKNTIKPKKLPVSATRSFSFILPFFPSVIQPIFNQVSCEPKINVEDDLRRACTEGETAILELMNELRNLVIEASKEYRNLLDKQIEITQKAIIAGPAAYDELPKYRSLADEICCELNEYMILLKTIGEVTYDQTIISVVMNENVNEKNLDFILKKYNELEVVLLKEFEENKRKEIELLENRVASIECNKM